MCLFRAGIEPAERSAESQSLSRCDGLQTVPRVGVFTCEMYVCQLSIPKTVEIIMRALI